MLKKYKIDILALFETHAGGNRAGQICQSLGFENTFREDVVGQSGGIWPLWRSSVGEIEIIESSSQFVFARLQNGEEKLNLIIVYAAPSASRRSGLWDKLRAIIQGMDGPVIIRGGTIIL